MYDGDQEPELDELDDLEDWVDNRSDLRRWLDEMGEKTAYLVLSAIAVTFFDLVGITAGTVHGDALHLVYGWVFFTLLVWVGLIVLNAIFD